MQPHVDFINQRWEEYTRLLLEEGPDWKWRVTVHPDDVGRFMDEWRAALASGRPMNKIGKLLILSRQHGADRVLVTVRDSDLASIRTAWKGSLTLSTQPSHRAWG